MLIAGRFRVEGPLGGGGAAQVFRAKDEQGGGEVALKIFPPSPVSSTEFRREAAISVGIDHANLIALVDAGVHDGHPYLALELVQGFNLRTWLAKGGGPHAEALAYGRQVFAGLDAMHRSGMSHGDIKPDNLLLSEETVRIIDFGRARLHHVFGGGEGMFPGTPAYMHPRLYQGGAPDALTDCFATWVTLYELLAGRRPYPLSVLQWADEADLGDFPAMMDARLQRLVHAGLTGQLPDARSGWLAITLYQRGLNLLPRPRPPRPQASPQRVSELYALAEEGRSLALVGDPEDTQPLLEALDRSWRNAGGNTLWMRSSWGEPDQPMSGALALAANAPHGLHAQQLARIDQDLGPLGSALTAAEPATRTWITAPAGSATGRRPDAERLGVALRRLLDSAPRPLIVLASGLDRVDGSSRRFLGGLVATGRLTIIGDALPHTPHGMPLEIETRHGVEAVLDAPQVSETTAALVNRARALGLPMGPLMARASGLTEAEVESAALEAEYAGLARWTGTEVVALPSTLEPEPALVAGWRVEAARRLDADEQPILVARYAMQGGDGARLAEVLDGAIARVIRLDPAEALELLAADPRPPNPARVLRHFRIALLARDMAEAERVLIRLRGLEGMEPADLAEAEAELAFRRGANLPALESYKRAVAQLGFPLREGIRGRLEDMLAFFKLMLRRPPEPTPNPRVGRLYEHLYDLYFCVNHRPLIRIHRTWWGAAPDDARARAVEIIWQAAFGQQDRASRTERQLLESVREDADPVGAAVVLLHRGISRSLTGDTIQAFADGVDAAERLMLAGDPYLAALATTLPSVCAFHLGRVEQLARLNERLSALVAATGERRAAAWARGNDAVIRWSQGDVQGAIEHTRVWADESRELVDANEAFARRFLADLLLEGGHWKEAVVELRRCDEVCERAGLLIDYTQARYASLLIADAMARRAGAGGLGMGWLIRRRARFLTRLSPRWTPRVIAANAWQAASAGRREQAANLFTAAYADALAREQLQDAWWVLHHQAMALDDADAATRALDLARDARLKTGPPRPGGK